MSRPQQAQTERESHLEHPSQDPAPSTRNLDPRVSDVRCLVHGPGEMFGSREPSEGDFPRPPARLGLGDLLTFAGEMLDKDSAVARLLRMADLPRASWLLLSERKRMMAELQAAREDFEELREMTATEQERWALRLAAADDERITLMDRLERAVDEIVSLELQLIDARRRIEGLEPFELEAAAPVGAPADSG